MALAPPGMKLQRQPGDQCAQRKKPGDSGPAFLLAIGCTDKVTGTSHDMQYLGPAIHSLPTRASILFPKLFPNCPTWHCLCQHPPPFLPSSPIAAGQQTPSLLNLLTSPKFHGCCRTMLWMERTPRHTIPVCSANVFASGGNQTGIITFKLDLYSLNQG